MTYPEVNIIHLPHRQDREKSLMKELREQEIHHFKLWDGIIRLDNRAKGIAQAHQQIVKHAKDNGFPYVIIAEDDIQFTSRGAFQYFCEQQPTDYDIYLGSVSYGRIGVDNTVTDFSGLLLYQVHSRFYDCFLSIQPQNHLDRSLKGKGCFVVSPQFVAIEYEGYSDNFGKVVNNSICYAGRSLFGRSPILY